MTRTQPVYYADLDGRHALVTGASGGVGAEVCHRLLRSGVRVLATDVDEEGLSLLARRLSGEGQIEVVAVNLGKPEAVTNLANVARDKGFQITLLVNNAAYFSREPLGHISIEGFDAAIAVNVRAPVLLIQELLPGIVQAGGGAVVNVASVAVRTGGAIDVLAYTASKGALVAATKSIAKTVAKQQIRVNAILPAAIDTPMLRGGFTESQIDSVTDQVPMGRLAQPDEVAAAVCWLLSEESSFVTGVSLDVNGGWVMT